LLDSNNTSENTPHRLQNHPNFIITVYKLVTKGTVEAKQGLINATLGDENSPLMQGLNQQEIESLLK